ncbi:MAG TPA: PASTA domain-containing protein [Epulopiscium sp.]|nr:PASTA domain-containing protein [Candidatus Epulonipiscium sp.]
MSGTTKIRAKKRKKDMSIRKATRRILSLAFLFGAASIGLVTRVGYLKVVKGDEFEKKVTLRTAGAEYEIQPLRGNIVDRNGKNMVVSSIAYDVILDPYVLLQSTKEQQTETLTELSKELGINIKELQDIVAKFPESKYEVIKKEVLNEVGKRLQDKKLKGLWLQETFVRQYPKETLASQTIGFYNKNKQGQYGVEQQYNDIMTGFTGRVFPKLQEGNIITSESVSAVSGHTLGITIDEVIQQYLEEALQKSAVEFKSTNAAVIAMNPNTGEILAMGSYPTYNPNKYNDISEQVGAEIWEGLDDAAKGERLNEVWKNYNIHMTYEPGSTFKPLLVAAALEEGVIGIDEQFYCPGFKDVAGEHLRCAKRDGHGHINLEQAIASSCNVAMMEIAEKLGKEKFIQYQKDFGLGEITGVDLPGEEAGILHRQDQMGPVELATASFGQSFNMTPLQLISAFSATINGGKLMKPYVLSQIIDEDGTITKENKPFLRRKVISKEVSDVVRLQAESVVTSGTGKSAAIPGYRIGGKTGTAQKLPREAKEYIYSFVGYAPVENPQIIVLVLYDETEVEGDGVGLAARVFKEMMEKTLPYLGIQPVDAIPGAYDETVAIPDFTDKDIYEASKTLENLKLDYEAIGIGKKINNQYPKPGAVIPTETTIKLYFSSSEPENCIIVPDLIGKTLEESQLEIANQGLAIEIEGTGEMISKQVPKANMKIEKGSLVKLILSEKIIE